MDLRIASLFHRDAQKKRLGLWQVARLALQVREVGGMQEPGALPLPTDACKTDQKHKHERTATTCPPGMAADPPGAAFERARGAGFDGFGALPALQVLRECAGRGVT